MKTKIEWATLISGNRIVTKEGYVIVHCPKHPYAKPNGYVYEHRLIMENHLCRFLETKEHVHHINGNRADNRFENLKVVASSDHAALHYRNLSPADAANRISKLVSFNKTRRIERREVLCACGCGSKFITPDNKGRFHSFVRGHNQKGKSWRWTNGR